MRVKKNKIDKSHLGIQEMITMELFFQAIILKEYYLWWVNDKRNEEIMLETVSTSAHL